MALGSVRGIQKSLKRRSPNLLNRARHGNWVNKTPNMMLIKHSFALVLKNSIPCWLHFIIFKELK